MDKLEKFKYIDDILKSVVANVIRMLSFSWKMNAKVTFGYYFTALLGALAPLVASLTLKYVIDYLIKYQKEATAIPILILAVLAGRYFLGFFTNLIQWGLNRTYFDFLFRYNLQNELSRRFLEKVSSLDIEDLENPEIQNLITKVRDTLNWRPPDFLRIFGYFFGNIVMYVSAFIILIPFGIWIPIVITFAAIPRLIIRAKFGNIQWSIYGSGAPQVKQLWYLNWLLSHEETIKEMKIFGSQNDLLKKLQNLQDYLFNLNKKPLDNYLKQLTFPPFFETIVVFLIAILFLPNVLSGAITIGTFTLLINMIDQINGSSTGSVINFGDMYEHNLYIDQYFEIQNLQKKIHQVDNPVRFKKISPPEIEFKNVSFRYPGSDKFVIKNLNFKIKSGENVALVGNNGAGKSTIIKLICRFYDVTHGEILVNGENIRELDIKQWYKFMGTLFQDFTHYYLTVKENITLGGSKFNEELMIEAAKKSGANGFIQKLPKKYDQMLGKEYEEGVELSGGQWQKLAIARAFYHKSPLLMLDEPTSAIDAEAEFEIFNNLEKEYDANTLILVSHRFSTVRNADRIFVIEDGKVVEEGNHKELLAKNGKYATMFNLQAKGYR